MRISDLFESVPDYDLQGRYDEFNRLYFGGELPRIPLSFKPLKNVGGQVIVAIRRNRRTRQILEVKWETLRMEISSAYVRAPQDLDGILLHEMIHVWEHVVMKDHDSHHGSLFLKKRKELIAASGIDVPLTDDTKGLELANASVQAVGVILRPFKDEYACVLMAVPGLLRALPEIETLARGETLVYVTKSPIWIKKAQELPLQRKFAVDRKRIGAGGKTETYRAYNLGLKWYKTTPEEIADLKANGKLALHTGKLTEAPIQDIHHVGAWGDNDRNSSFKDKKDRMIVSNPAHVERMKNMWSKTQQDFNILFVNNPEGRLYQELGKVDLAWLNENMPRTVADPNFKLEDNAVNILFTNNSGAARIPLTPWIMAHRFGHAIGREMRLRADQIQKQNGGILVGSAAQDWKEAFDGFEEDINSILAGYGAPVFRYNNPRWGADSQIQTKWTVRRKLYQVIGTMKSAREANLREHFEFEYELFAQWLITGGIKFNPLPRSFKYGHTTYHWKEPLNDLDFYNNALETQAEVLSYRFNDAVSRCIGKIYVM